MPFWCILNFAELPADESWIRKKSSSGRRSLRPMVLWTGEQLPRIELSYKQAGKWEEIGRKRLQGGDSHPRKESALFQGDNKNWEGILEQSVLDIYSLKCLNIVFFQRIYSNSGFSLKSGGKLLYPIRGKELYYSWLRPFDFLNKNSVLLIQICSSPSNS